MYSTLLVQLKLGMNAFPVLVWTLAKHGILRKVDTFKSPDTDLKRYFLGSETVNTNATVQTCEGDVM